MKTNGWNLKVMLEPKRNRQKFSDFCSRWKLSLRIHVNYSKTLLTELFNFRKSAAQKWGSQWLPSEGFGDFGESLISACTDKWIARHTTLARLHGFCWISWPFLVPRMCLPVIPGGNFAFPLGTSSKIPLKSIGKSFIQKPVEYMGLCKVELL